jgi:hypothetical protein
MFRGSRTVSFWRAKRRELLDDRCARSVCVRNRYLGDTSAGASGAQYGIRSSVSVAGDRPREQVVLTDTVSDEKSREIGAGR